MATLYQAKPVLEIRRLAVDGGTPTVYVQDGDWALFTGTWNECSAFIKGFEKAWEVKAGPEPDPFTEALVLDAWQTYLLEDR